MTTLIIPDHARDPVRLEPRCMIIYGNPGLGKTPIALALGQLDPDSVLMLDTHQGSHQCRGRVVDIRAIAEQLKLPPWRVYLQACQQARQLNPPPKFLVVDHVGHLADWADNMALDVFMQSPIGKSWPNKDENGTIISKGFDGQSILELPGPKGSAGWGRLWEAFQKLIEAAHLGAPFLTIFIGHPMQRIAFATDPKDANVKQDDLAKAEELDLGGPKMKKDFCSTMDAIGFMSRSWEGNRINVSFKSKDAFTRTRCPHLEGRTLWFSNPCTLAEWARIYPNTLSEHLLPEDRAALADLLSRYGGAKEAAK